MRDKFANTPYLSPDVPWLGSAPCWALRIISLFPSTRLLHDTFPSFSQGTVRSLPSVSFRSYEAVTHEQNVWNTAKTNKNQNYSSKTRVFTCDSSTQSIFTLLLHVGYFPWDFLTECIRQVFSHDWFLSWSHYSHAFAWVPVFSFRVWLTFRMFFTRNHMLLTSLHLQNRVT